MVRLSGPFAALEWFASLLCLVRSQLRRQNACGAGAARHYGRPIKQSLGEPLFTSKYLSYVILLELTVQLWRHKIMRDLRWQPRDENLHAGDPTNEAFGNFCFALRIAAPLDQLHWKI